MGKGAFAVAIFAVLSQRAVAAGIVTGSDIVENQRTVAKMSLSELVLNASLPLHDPVHGSVEFVFVDCFKPQFFAQSAGGGLAVESLAVASLEAGARMRATTMAKTQERFFEGRDEE